MVAMPLVPVIPIRVSFVTFKACLPEWQNLVIVPSFLKIENDKFIPLSILVTQPAIIYLLYGNIASILAGYVNEA
jgi:hypothetical protein